MGPNVWCSENLMKELYGKRNWYVMKQSKFVWKFMYSNCLFCVEYVWALAPQKFLKPAKIVYWVPDMKYYYIIHISHIRESGRGDDGYRLYIEYKYAGAKNSLAADSEHARCESVIFIKWLGIPAARRALKKEQSIWGAPNSDVFCTANMWNINEATTACVGWS